MNDIMYAKNMKALKEHQPEIAKWVESQKPVQWADLIKSKNDDYNILVKSHSNSAPAYDMNNPRKQPRALVKNASFFEQNVTVLVGIGVGHLLNLILKKKEKHHKIILIEPVGEFLKWSFGIYDFTKYIENKTLIIVGDDTNAIPDLISFFDNYVVVEDWVVLLEKYTTIRPEYADCINIATASINQVRCNTGTIAGAGAVIAANDVANIPYCIKNRGIAELKDLYKDKPAILVSTGPSLRKNIHILRKIAEKGNVLIIAVAQALRILLAYDIRPDFICTVDYGKTNFEHFDGMMDCEIPLIALNRTYAPILKKWRGPKFIVVSPQPGYSDSATGLMEKKGGLEHGGSVAHMCLGAALHLGCNPIIMTGQDLAYEDNQSHAFGADAAGTIDIDKNGYIKWDINDPRSHIKQSQNMGPVQQVTGYWGKPVSTNIGLASFITSFESIIKGHPDTVIINSTEGGASIKGAQQKTLETLRSTLESTVALNKDVLKPLLKLSATYKNDIEEMIPALKNDIENLDTIIVNCKKALKTTTALKHVQYRTDIKQDVELKKLLAENEKFSNLAHEATKKNALLGVAIYSASRAIFSREYKAKGSIKHLIKNEDDMEIRIRRNQLILNKALSESRSLKKLYTKALKQLENMIKINKEDPWKNAEKTKLYEKVSFKDAHIFFKNGNWMRPFLDAKKILFMALQPELFEEALKIRTKAMEMKEASLEKAEKEYVNNQNQLDYNELVKEALRIGRENKNFVKACALLKEAVELVKDNEVARWGLATTYHHLDLIDQSLEHYGLLVKDYPDNLKYQFEYGNVMLLQDQKKGVQIIKEVMTNTEEFDYYFAQLGNLAMLEKNYIQAEAFFTQYLKKWPSDFKVIDKLADCYKSMGDDKKEASARRRSQKLKGAAK